MNHSYTIPVSLPAILWHRNGAQKSAAKPSRVRRGRSGANAPADLTPTQEPTAGNNGLTAIRAGEASGLLELGIFV